MTDAELLPAVVPHSELVELPPILVGSMPTEVRNRVAEFFTSVAAIFEAWVAASPNTRSALTAAT